MGGGSAKRLQLKGIILISTNFLLRNPTLVAISVRLIDKSMILILLKLDILLVYKLIEIRQYFRLELYYRVSVGLVTSKHIFDKFWPLLIIIFNNTVAKHQNC